MYKKVCTAKINSKMHFNPSPSWFRFLSVLLYCLLLLQLYVEVLSLVPVLLISTLCLFSIAIILMGKRERAG